MPKEITERNVRNAKENDQALFKFRTFIIFKGRRESS